MGTVGSERTPSGPVPSAPAHHPSPGRENRIIKGHFRLAAPIRPVLGPARAHRRHTPARLCPFWDRLYIWRCGARLNSFYSDEYRDSRNSHFSITLSLSDSNKEGIFFGFIPKETADGRKLFDILKDGKEHGVILELEYGPRAQSDNILTINRFVKDGWADDVHWTR